MSSWCTQVATPIVKGEQQNLFLLFFSGWVLINIHSILILQDLHRALSYYCVCRKRKLDSPTLTEQARNIGHYSAVTFWLEYCLQNTLQNLAAVLATGVEKYHILLKRQRDFRQIY